MAKVQNCPQCGTMMMNGWCPQCHPNPKMAGAYKTFAFGHMLQSVGCIIMLVVFVLIPLCIVAYACATS
jgi:hypothetical protein